MKRRDFFDIRHPEAIIQQFASTDILVDSVGQRIGCTRPVWEGIVTATGRVVHRNRSQFIAESVLNDSKDNQIARASGIFVRSKIPLSDQVGYK